MMEIALSIMAMLATMCFGVFLYKVFEAKQEERQEAEKNKSHDYDYELSDKLNKKTFGDLL